MKKAGATVLAVFLISSAPAQDVSFIRGDANDDASIDLADSVFLLKHLFLGQGRLGCADAADANDDGELDISDPVLVLLYLFAGGARPPAPFERCGPDATADALSCASYEHCRLVSGRVALGDLPVGGAVVRIVRLSDGGELASGASGDDGTFSLAAGIDEPIELKATGGQAGGADLAGELRAVYRSEELPAGANATLVTTLVASMARPEEGLDVLARRDAAVATLVGIGMIAEGEWAEVEPASVASGELRRQASGLGLDEWLSRLAADLDDGDLSAELMAGFPEAHGRILEVSVGGGEPVLVFPGRVATASARVLSWDPEALFELALTDGPEGMSVDGAGSVTYAVPPDAPTGRTISFTLWVGNRASGKGRAASGSLFVMRELPVASGTVSAAGGVVEDEWGETALVVPEGAVAADTTITVSRSRDPEGQVVTVIESDGETGEVELYLPPVDLLEATTPDPHGAGGGGGENGKEEGSGGAAWPVSNLWWSAPPAYFWSTDLAARLGIATGNRLPDQRARRIMIRLTDGPLSIVPHVPARLSSTRPRSSPGFDWSEKEIVLFVHGYTPSSSGMGGGASTWGEFPALLESLDGGRYVAFEFRWITAARFEDAAADLAGAVSEIVRVTQGRPIHIVAHSFGGVLARTYLQGLASGGKSEGREAIASLTTVGTPHSGIADRAGTFQGVELPGGQDSWLFEACGQVSCYQMGEPLVYWPWTKILLGIDADPARVAALLSDTASNPFAPDGLPILVLIGLSTSRADPGVVDEGDGLITYEGERFRPLSTTGAHAGSYEALLDRSLLGGAEVTEKILGTDADLRPGSDASGFRPGYRHVAHFSVGPHDAKAEVEVSDIRHAKFRSVSSWIRHHPGPGVSTSPPLDFALALSVRDARTSAPLAGARVTVEAEGVGSVGEATTSDSGLASDLVVPFFPESAYDVLVTRDGYHPSYRFGLIRAAASVEKTDVSGEVLLEPDEPLRGGLRVVVLEEGTGDPVAGVLCEVMNDWRTVASGSTAPDGSREFGALVRGLYSVRLTKPGYAEATYVASVQPGATTSVTLRMMPTPVVPDFTYLGRNPQGYPEYRHDPTGIIFVRLLGGTFRMGSPETEPFHDVREGPVHQVTLSPFLIAKYELTQGQWEAVMGTNPSWFDGTRNWDGAPVDPPDNRANLPVEQVSWNDVQELEARTGLRLPTEAEWEYAARGGTVTAFSFGSGTNCADWGCSACPEGDAFMWYCANSGQRPHEVGSRAPNPFGLHDMHGNIREWCEDVYDPVFYGKPEASGPDPLSISGSSSRVDRGGTWADSAGACRSAGRPFDSPLSGGYYYLGFRPASASP